MWIPTPPHASPRRGPHAPTGAHLEELDLAKNHIIANVTPGAADVCLQAQEVLTSPGCRLRELSLASNRIGDAALLLLFEGLRANKSLERLCLSDCNMTDGAGLAVAKVLAAGPWMR